MRFVISVFMDSCFDVVVHSNDVVVHPYVGLTYAGVEQHSSVLRPDGIQRPPKTVTDRAQPPGVRTTVLKEFTAVRTANLL